MLKTLYQKEKIIQEISLNQKVNEAISHVQIILKTEYVCTLHGYSVRLTVSMISLYSNVIM